MTHQKNFMNNFVTLALISVLQIQSLYSQLKGKINDENGVALAYATIYIKGTSTGTISNGEGYYELELTEYGEKTITFQYVGYKKLSITINYQGFPIQKNITLIEDENILNELVITADREDPSYPIIRKAIKKREYYKKQLKSYEADLYVKGLVKITESPKKILGEEIGTMNGVLDTTGKGIVYLSESKSKFYFQQPNKTKEVMVSSIRSGSNSLFSANQFSWASFDIYTEYLNFSRSIVSPIADVAFSYYDFRLEQVIIDANGYTINKIKIIPKSKNEPLLTGYIYITDDLWNIYSTDLILAGPAIKNTFLDTIAVKQIYIPIRKPDTWRLFSQVTTFKAGLLGFKMAGNFSYIFSEYLPDKDVNDKFVNNEIFSVDVKALKKDSLFWNKVRPIPLTTEEQNDYFVKDSLQNVWNTKSYMDSVDRKDNKFTLLKFLTGYTHSNTYKKTSWSYPSPLSSLRFNAVEGWKLDLNVVLEKSDTTFRKWTVQPVIQYGFADRIFKPSIGVEYRFDNYNQGYITFSAGRQNVQFDPRQPVSERGNTWSSLWDKLNGIRLYQSNFIEAGFRKEIYNGYFIRFTTAYVNRKPVDVNSQYSFRKPNALYEENIPRTDLAQSALADNKYWKNKISLLIRPGQKYSSYPFYKDRDVSDWPNVEIEYENGIPLDQISAQFNKFTLRIRDIYLNLRLIGYSSYNIEAGSYLGNKPSYFGDFFHPMGNELLLPINPDLSSFNLMPYYAYSSDHYYAQINFRHHFNGFVFDKIPLLNKTSLKMVIGFSALYEPTNGKYIETFLGVENFRIGPLKLFDIDYTWSFDNSGFRDHGVTIRLSQLLNN